MVLGPCHRGDRSADWELVADSFFLSPIQADLIDEDDVVTLGHGYLLRIRRKFDSSDKIALLSLVGGFGGELIFFLSIFVEEVNRLNRSRCTRSEAPTANFLPEGAQAMEATFFMLSSNGMTLPAYLSFIQNLNNKRS